MAPWLFEISNLCFGYRGRPVLQDLSLNLAPGRLYGLLGPNGCGKSTLVDLLVRHLKPAAGAIRLHGKDLAGYRRQDLARQMALVPQNFYINFPFTVQEVVMMGRYPHLQRFARPSTADMEIVAQVMKQTGVDAFADRSIAQLSGGERQRVVAARALAQDTPVMILDEPTSNMDINHSLALLGLVKTSVERQGKTAVVVLQDLNLAALFSDELVLMKKGRVAAAGPAATVLTAATIHAVFDVEARIDYSPYADAPQVVFKRT